MLSSGSSSSGSTASVLLISATFVCFQFGVLGSTESHTRCVCSPLKSPYTQSAKNATNPENNENFIGAKNIITIINIIFCFSAADFLSIDFF